MSRAKSVVEPLRIELPFPDRRLSPNSRVGWREKAAVVGRYREECGWTAVASYNVGVSTHGGGGTLVIGNVRTLTPPVEATVTFVVPDRRRRDLDNLLAMLKPAWDGLTDAGVLAGDDASQFKVASAEVVVRHDRWVPVPDSQLVAKSQSCVIVELRGGGETE